MPTSPQDPPRNEPTMAENRRVHDTAAFIAHTTQAGILLTDRAGRIEWVNAGFERLTGFRLHEIQGRKPGEFLQGPETDPATIATMRDAIAAGKGFKVEVLNYHRSGESYWLGIDCESRCDVDGTVTGFFAIQTDITQQVVAERKLAETAQRLRIALDASELGVWRLNLRSGCAEWDDRMYDMLQVQRGTRLSRGAFLFRYLHRDDRCWMRQQIRRLREGADVACGEVRLRLPGKRGIYVELRMVMSRDAVGRAEWLTGTTKDITSRKRDHERLLAAHREVVDLKTALDEHAIVAVTDARGKILRVNGRFCAVSGYSEEELIGADHRLINSKTHPPAFFRDLWRTISSGKVWHGEICNRAKNGAFYWVDTTIVPFLGADGKPEQYIAIRADVTDRKVAEQHVLAYHRQVLDLKTALDEHAIVAVTDARGRIKRVNGRFCSVSGYFEQELIGADHRLVNSKTHPPEFFRELWRTISSGKVWHGEICNRAKDGSLYWVDTTIVPFLGPDGKPEQYIAIRADVTARKRAEERRIQIEEQLARTRKMESLGSFAGGIAHDFNNLIAGIGGHIELAMLDLPAGSPVTPLLQTAERGCIRARDLAKRLLMFARRGTKSEIIPVDVSKLVRETVPILRPALGKDMRLELAVQESLPPALADEAQVMQILMNLCTNGSQAMRGAGTLSITVKTGELPEDSKASFPDARPGSHIVISVSDTGCGMDAATKARIFEPFFSTKSADKGTGLGLSVVEDIVRQHRGAISVHSKLGAGTRFDVYLPAATQLLSRQLPNGAANRVLVVDDDPDLLALLVEVLRARGLDVDGVCEPRAALSHFESQPHSYGLLLSDYAMPGMNGDELAHRARRVRPDLPVMIVSGTRNPLPEERARSLGIRAQFQKPFVPEELTAAVHQVLQESRAA